jgi:hypothetical protein
MPDRLTMSIYPWTVAACSRSKKPCALHRGFLVQWQRQGFFASVTWVRASTCTSVIPVVFYLSTWLAGCSVGPEISCGARKLAQTPWISKKKKRSHVHCLSLTANRNKEISSMCSLERNTNELLANMGRWLDREVILMEDAPPSITFFYYY